MAFEPSSTFLQVNTAAPTGRSNATAHMLGVGGLITPVASGRIVVICTGVVATGTTTDGATYQLYYGTGAAPTNNDTPAADSGTAFGGLQSIASLVASELSTSFAISGAFSVAPAQFSGTTRSNPSYTTYWIDLGFQYVTGGTVTFTTVNLIAFEI
jgi:hypothetical protein